MPSARKFYGKYRGTVVHNVDPQNIGRIQATVPDVSGTALTGWALPCVPAAGVQMGIYAVPPVGSQVWIEFEQGDPKRPIWVGGFWSKAGDVPTMARAAPAGQPAITLQTPGQNGLTIDDAPGLAGGIVLKSTTGASIIVNDTGIHIQNGKGASIVLVGPAVTVNGGALEIF
jgi:uncharacterized protein involved in type VI secretion and phage assembly